MNIKVLDMQQKQKKFFGGTKFQFCSKKGQFFLYYLCFKTKIRKRVLNLNLCMLKHKN